MTDDELLRYSRHILLDELGIAGQQKLLSSQVLIVGAGGLGCPAALYLAASGVGRITVADHDVIDLTNLQRQIAHSTERLGEPKVSSLRNAMHALNPHIQILPLQEKLAGHALEQAVAQADVVLDCSDNFPTRYAINRACVQHRVPLVSGAAVRFDGQLAVFDFRERNSPCYHCLFPESGSAEEINCATLGIFAPLTGVIGSLQATETLKLLTGAGNSLHARLQLFEALHHHWHAINITRDPQCAVCHAQETSL